MSALRIYVAAAAGAAAAGVGVWQWIRSHRVTPEERERQRRDYLSRTGRICIGTVLDLQEIGANGHAAQHLLIYRYDVGGVSYEASQDVTQLRDLLDFTSFKLGLPSSIKYDPHNPGNSIVVSEAWTGLRN